MHVGLDFGTTNTTAAIYDGTEVTLIPLDPVARNPYMLRTALFMTPEGERSYGRAAINAFTEGNVGREIIYERRTIGSMTQTYADVGTIEQELVGLIDANQPGRLFQSIKTMLRDPLYIQTSVFGTMYTLEQLIGFILREIKDRIEAFTGETITSMVIGRPVHYGTALQDDERAITRMTTACRIAGLEQISFLPEPVAAAYAYAASEQQARNVLVFDFGGGTLDVTVMRIDAEDRTVLATNGVAIGGDILDSKIVTGALTPYFGSEARLGSRKLPLPALLMERLSSWQDILDLHTPKILQIIDEAVRTGDRQKELTALRTLVRQNYGLLLYEAAEQAKRRLSSAERTTISMHYPQIDFDHEMPRFEFERLIGPEARAIAKCVDQVIADSGLKHEDIDIILRTGGSSRIPRFVRLLEERFGSERLREQDPFTSVGAGLAIAASAGVAALKD